MRLGFLGRLSDLPLNGQMIGSHPGIASELHRAGHPPGGENTLEIYITFVFFFMHLMDENQLIFVFRIQFTVFK